MKLFLIHTQNRSMEEYLSLEEGLLHGRHQNFCIFHQGTSPAVILGRSLHLEEWVNLKKLQEAPIALFRRFSGGGAVVVDNDTFFVSFILSKEDFPYTPTSFMDWTEDLYRNSWNLPSFSLRERDYTMQGKKCGGNAAYFTKTRFLHHASFLWDFSKENMEYLLHPKKCPMYRDNRAHGDFLCSLSSFLPNREFFYSSLQKELSKRFDLEGISEEEVRQDLSRKKYRQFVFREVF